MSTPAESAKFNTRRWVVAPIPRFGLLTARAKATRSSGFASNRR